MRCPQCDHEATSESAERCAACGLPFSPAPRVPGAAPKGLIVIEHADRVEITIPGLRFVGVMIAVIVASIGSFIAVQLLLAPLKPLVLGFELLVGLGVVALVLATSRKHTTLTIDRAGLRVRDRGVFGIAETTFNAVELRDVRVEVKGTNTETTTETYQLETAQGRPVCSSIVRDDITFIAQIIDRTVSYDG
jgi:hypothetical protein